MRLLRIAVVTTGYAWLPAGKQGALVAGDVEVNVRAVTVEGQPNPTWVLVIASADILRPPIDDQRHLISMNRDHFEPRILDRQGNDSEIKRSFDHPLGDLTSDGAMDVDLNLRIGLLERGQNLGQHVKASGLVCSKPQLPATQSAQFSRRKHRLFPENCAD